MSSKRVAGFHFSYNHPVMNMISRFAKPAAVLLFTIVAGCATLPSDFERVPSYALIDTADTRLAREIQPLVDDHAPLSGFHVINDGANAFAARLNLIQAADKSIDAQYYIWHSDLTGNALFNQLLLAADRGVRVRILLDDFNTAGQDNQLQLLDAHPNLDIRLYNPFANRGMRVADYVSDFKRVDHRMHTKTLTVDNQVTIFGGRNVGDEYFAAGEDVIFSDMDALAIGPIVREISDQFDLFWNSEWVYPIYAFRKEEATTAKEIEVFRMQSEEQMQIARTSEYAEIIRKLETKSESDIDQLPMSWSRWLLAHDLPDNIVAREITQETHLAPNLKQGMDRAQQELIIVSPYFVPGEAFTQYLTQRVKDGVRVRILTNSLQSTDSSLVHAGYMRYREDLLAGGVELYEFKATGNKEMEDKLNKNRIDADHATLHAKFFGFDRRFLFIGSYNMDARSKVLNTELGAYFENPENARRLSEIFDQHILLFAYQLKLDDDGELEWLTRTNDGEVVKVEQEPDTTFWKRFNTRILSPIVPESEL